MYFWVVLAFIALAISSAASPVNSSDGTKIPLYRRSTIRSSDGTTNLQALKSHEENAMLGLFNAFANYEKTTGSPHPLAINNSYITKRADGGAPFKQSTETGLAEEYWYAHVGLGSPEEPFILRFDTASSDIILHGVDCKANCPTYYRLYSRRSSTTNKDTGYTVNMRENGHVAASGEVFSDFFQIAGVRIMQSFVALNSYQYGSRFQAIIADGTIGMAPVNQSSYGMDTFFKSIVDQGQVSRPIFYMSFLGSTAELCFGACNHKSYRGDFMWMPIINEGFWQIKMQGLSINKKMIPSSRDSILNSSWTFISGPSHEVASFYEGIDRSRLVRGFYQFPCDSKPRISFTFSGREFMMSSRSLSLGKIASKSTFCFGSIIGRDPPWWSLGTSFMVNVIAGFNTVNNEVGLAEPIRTATQ